MAEYLKYQNRDKIMTRKEEIKKRLFKISTSNFNYSVVDSSAYFAGYVDGVHWADQHPHWIIVEDKKSKIKHSADNIKYILIQWSDSQYLMTIEGFKEHSSLADADYAGSSAYFVKEDWLKEVMEDEPLFTDK